MINAFDELKMIRTLLQCCDFTRHLSEPVMLLLKLMIILVGLSTRTIGEDTYDFQNNIPARVIWAALDRDTELPCDITPPEIDDGVKLVLWFKDATGIPLYSLDSRSGTLKLATHSALAGDLGERLFFSVGQNLKNSKLQIKNVRPSDGGVYRCRVDFFNSPTRNFRHNLTLVESPDEPRIFDAQGKEISTIAGPFREGYELFLSCQVVGGRPVPNVTWWRNEEEIVGMSQPSSVEGMPAVINQLFIGTVTREFFGAKFECRAQSSKLLEVVSKEISIQVHLKPIRIKIITPNELLTAQHSVPIRCEAWGSYPPARIKWLLDGEPIRNADVTVHSDRDDSNVTSSILTLHVLPENDLAELSCRATNPWFSGDSIEDTRTINVAYVPTVSVHLANDDQTKVVTRAENQNVTFKCRADAKPPVMTYGWFKNGMKIMSEDTDTLEITLLERETAGFYACSAINSEGETRSSTITLKVQFSPRCKPGTEQSSIGAINMHTLSVKCEVEADPPESVRFSWTYNNTRNVSPVLNSRISSHGLISAMTYMPQSDSEFVTLACWAINVVGQQKTPCLVHIIPAKIPDPPRACEIRNDTTLEVVCAAGFNGGLDQHFLLEVIGGFPIYNTETTRDAHEIENEISTMNDQATLSPLYRIQETMPQFRLNNLDPGREYQFMVYAVNAKGRSNPPVVIDRIRTPSLYMPYDETVLAEEPTPAETSYQGKDNQISFPVIIAAISCASFITISIVIAGIIVLRKTRRKPPEPQEIRKRMRPARTDVPSMYAEEDVLEEQFTRSADIRHSRASTIRNSRFISEGFIQYSQPSLNDPDLILPRGEVIQFTTISTNQ